MSGIWQTITNGLTYNNSRADCAINYAIILATLLPHAATRAQGRANGLGWLWVAGISAFVQALLWFTLGAVGISVVWCSLAGFNAFYARAHAASFRHNVGALFLAGCLLALVGVGYYLIVLPLLTTVAHALAVLMGIGLFYLHENSRGKAA